MLKIIFAAIFIISAPLAIFAETAVEKEISFYNNAGWELMAEELPADAALSFQKAVDLDPYNLQSLYGLAKAYMYSDNLQPAEQALAHILSLDPANVDAMLLLAKLYAWNEYYEESIAMYKKVAEIEPSNIEAKTGLAEIYNWSGFKKESIEQYKKVLIEDPRNRKAYKGLAESYMWDDRLKEAKEIYKNGLEIWPDNIELRLGLAKIYDWMGYWSKSKKEYRKVLNSDPRNSDAQKGIRDVKAQSAPANDFIFRYIRERDGGGWQANTYTYGYRHTRVFDRGHNFYVSYYFNDITETDKKSQKGHIGELGGTYNLNGRITFLGSADIRSYNENSDTFSGVNLSSVLKYFRRNTVTLRYTREIFDVLDNIKTNSYGVETNTYLGNMLLLNNAFTYNDISDGNISIDTYHAVTIIASNKTPDLHITAGYRHRNYYQYAALYYTPQDLDSMIYSFYVGQTLKETTTIYGIAKLYDNSDEIDNYYYMAGFSSKLSNKFLFGAEVSYFDTSGDYNALTVSSKLTFML